MCYVSRMRYRGPIFRPPSEADSYILQIAYGCSWNQCTFCHMYPGVPFRLRPVGEVLEDIEEAGRSIPQIRRVFLADGDAMVLGRRHLLRILAALVAHLPNLERVGIYTDAKGVLRKDDDTLHELVDAGLGIVYLGLESGSEEVLRRLRKEATAAEMTEAMRRCRDAGLQTSVIALIGAGGRELSETHADETARVVSAMAPHYFSLLTLMILDGSPLAAERDQGLYESLEPLETLHEMRRILAGIQVDESLVFRTNHASTYLPLSGTLPADKPGLLERLDWAIDNGVLRPEYFRAL